MPLPLPLPLPLKYRSLQFMFVFLVVHIVKLLKYSIHSTLVLVPVPTPLWFSFSSCNGYTDDPYNAFCLLTWLDKSWVPSLLIDIGKVIFITLLNFCSVPRKSRASGGIRTQHDDLASNPKFLTTDELQSITLSESHSSKYLWWRYYWSSITVP